MVNPNASTTSTPDASTDTAAASTPQPAPLNRIEEERVSTQTPVVRPRNTAAANDVDAEEPFAEGPSRVLRVPRDVEEHYVMIDGRFYHRRNTSELAFEDFGNKLETRSDSRSVADTLVRIAETRGWESIRATGTAAFCREVWLAGTLRQIHVNGYSPTEADRAELATRAHARSPQGSSETSALPTTPETLPSIAGELLEHGQAPYQHAPNNSASYYAIVQTADGQQRTVWGVDLERSINAAGAEVGDLVRFRSAGRQSVSLEVPVFDTQGAQTGTTRKQVERVVWETSLADASSSPAKASDRVRERDAANSYAATAAIASHLEHVVLDAEQRVAVTRRVRENTVRAIQQSLWRAERTSRTQSHHAAPEAELSP